MAKVSSKPEKNEMPSDAEGKAKAIEAALAQIEKDYGEGSIMRLGKAPKIDIDVIPTGSLSLDMALGTGGLPRGRITEIYGPDQVKPLLLSMLLPKLRSLAVRWHL